MFCILSNKINPFSLRFMLPGRMFHNLTNQHSRCELLLGMFHILANQILSTVDLGFCHLAHCQECAQDKQESFVDRFVLKKCCSAS